MNIDQKFIDSNNLNITPTMESTIKKKVANIATITNTMTVVVTVSLLFGHKILEASCLVCWINLNKFVIVFCPC